MAENKRKIKLTMLLELLRSETDCDHPMTTASIIDRMNSLGININRKVLADDIEVLNSEGFEVMQTKVGKSNGYYVDDRSFSVPELKILIDAAQAASFITQKKTEELISKIAALGGIHQAEILEANIVEFNTRKHSNEQIYYNVETLEKALSQKKKIAFKYFDIDENKNKVYRRDGRQYYAEPISLVFIEDNYYLMCNDTHHEGIANYRVDRMEYIKLCDMELPFGTPSQVNVGEYTEKTFKMYPGKECVVTVEFDRSVINSVYDKFGEDIKIRKSSGSTCVAEIPVSVSPTFFGWVFQFGKKMKIVSPESVIGEYCASLDLQSSLYTAHAKKVK